MQRALTASSSSKRHCIKAYQQTHRYQSTSTGNDIVHALDRPASLLPSRSSTRIASNGHPTPGRFGYSALKKPQDFVSLSRRTQRRADAIVKRLLDYVPSAGLAGASSSASFDKERERDLLVQVKQIDRLSDLLCGVIDLAEVVRNLDPDPEWVQHADATYAELCNYMNELNTHVGLYEALKRVHDAVSASSSSSNPSSSSKLFAALTVSSQFLADFEKSGIHLPRAQRERFVGLSDEILALGRAFTAPAEGDEFGAPSGGQSSEAGSGAVFVTLQELAEWNTRFASLVAGSASTSSTTQGVYIDPASAEGQSLRREHPSSTIRERFYRAAYPPGPSNERVSLLEQLLGKRAQLAKLVGKDSWAHVALGDKMARTPENVISFLRSLSERNLPLAKRDVDVLAETKRNHLMGQSRSQDSKLGATKIQAWDRDYYISRALSISSPSSSFSSSLSSYFSIGTCISGLSALFRRLYGVHFALASPASSASSEIWLPNEVRKIDVFDEAEGKIGEIWCDLFAREGKPAGAAHFTVRCSRRVDDDMPDKDAQYYDPDAFPVAGVSEGRDMDIDFPLKSETVHYTGRKGSFQLPVVVLSCDFEKPSNDQPSLLAWREVETLFHEMGHAMHSMIGRTDYHNVAGTRCATDLVELPSILMEHFLSSPKVLALFASHWRTGAPLPLDHLAAVRASTTRFGALESNSQICMAAFDQACHADTVTAQGWSSTDIWEETQRSYDAIQPAKGTAWQAHFTHLYGYGATYYSYLFDRAIAARVYSTLFEKDPLSREAGERYKDELLRHGGGKAPWECVGALLGDEIVKQGDERAMDAVGSWNVDP